MTQDHQPLGIVERIKAAQNVGDADFLLNLAKSYHEASAKTIRRCTRAHKASIARITSSKTK